MSFFSPAATRSRSTRAVLCGVYTVLTLGALAIIGPLVVMISGSTAGAYEAESSLLYPKFLFQERALWARFIDAKYGGHSVNLRMAWGDSEADFYRLSPPKEDAEALTRLARWDAFRVAHGPLLAAEAGLGFTRTSKREAALENRRFRQWLLARFEGDLPRMNAELLTQTNHATNILPPAQGRLYRPTIDRPYYRAFDEYLITVPDSHRLIWNAGNLYRAVYLPRTFGPAVSAYNLAQGTAYRSFDDVPFPATVPREGAEPWFNYVRRLLNPAFVELTSQGMSALAASGMERTEFIRTRAVASDVRVVSLDGAYAAWATTRGFTEERIPQAEIDWRDFQATKAFWRWQFTTQNFVFVFDEVMIQGNGIRNTAILIFLSVVGALTINPLAAYALSRYRLPQGYQLLLFFVATIAFPAEVVMIPNFLQLKELGLLNTFGALVLPGLVNGFSIFLLKGFFDSVPRELYEAADIDGANEWQIFWGLTMSLSKPILAVIALNAFVAAYGAFFFALILAPDQRMWTLMVWIYQLRQTSGPGIIYASLLITAVPTLVVYLFAQNVILRGLVVPSEK